MPKRFIGRPLAQDGPGDSNPPLTPDSAPVRAGAPRRSAAATGPRGEYAALNTMLSTLLDPAEMESWLEFAFYPVLLTVFVIASLGVPIPEDLPLIAAGLILRAHPETASFAGTFVVSLVGIMSGDIILYGLGRRWGRGVVQHRSIRWLITPRRLATASQRFRRYGTWMCFFGRFVVGVRAAMCITAGVTRFPFWRFVLADMSGAVLSIPLFVGLGYLFVPMLATLHEHLLQAQRALLLIAATALAMLIVHEYRRHVHRPGRPTKPAVPAARTQRAACQPQPSRRGPPAQAPGPGASLATPAPRSPGPAGP